MRALPLLCLAWLLGSLTPLTTYAADCGPGEAGPTACEEGVASQPSAEVMRGAGNPIDLITGNKYQKEVDLPALPGVLGLEIVRHYNSNLALGNAPSGLMGRGWRLSYETELTEQGQTIQILQADGRRLIFNRDAINPSLCASPNPTQGTVAISGNQSGKRYIWNWPEGRRLIFNARGQLERIAAPTGEAVVLTRAPDGKLLRIVDPQGRQLRLQYPDQAAAAKNDRFRGVQSIDSPVGRFIYEHGGSASKAPRQALANLSAVAYPATPASSQTITGRRYHYDDQRFFNLLTGISAYTGTSLGRISSFAYDTNGKAIESRHGRQAVKLDRSGAGVTNVTDQLGRITRFTHTMIAGEYRVLEVRGPGCYGCGPSPMRYGYDKLGRLTEETELDKQGRPVKTEKSTLDALGRIKEQQVIAYVDGIAQLKGWTERYEYEGPGLSPTRIIRPSVNPAEDSVTALRYNERGQLTQVSESGYAPTPEGAFVRIRRSATLEYQAGRLIAIDGPRPGSSDTLRFDYDAQGRVSGLIDAVGNHLRVLAYDAAGRPARLQQNALVPIEIDYDFRGLPNGIRRGPLKLAYTYGAQGELLQATSPDGTLRKLAYDEDGQQISLSDGQGNRFSTERDASGNPSAYKLLAANGAVLRAIGFAYDAQSQLTAVRNAQGKVTTSLEYDDTGRLQTLSDAAGTPTRQRYNALGMLEQLQEAGRAITAYGEDSERGTTHLTDARGNTTTYGEDDFGLLRFAQSADSGLTRYHYDEAGNLVGEDDAQGHHMAYLYDAAGRLIEKATPEGRTQLLYEGTQVSRLLFPGGEERYEHDAFGRLISHERLIDGHRFVTGYRYDARTGQALEKTLPDGQVLRYHYDSASGTLRAITRQDYFGLRSTVVVGELHYQPFGPLTHLIHGNGIATRYGYDREGRVTTIDSGQIQKLRYDYDDNDRITGIRFGERNERYGYDSLGHLTQADTALGHYRYDYDELGNRTRPARTARRSAMPTAPKGRAIVCCR